MILSIKNRIFFIAIGLILVLSSCDKEKTHPKDSILGTWRCLEEGSLHGFRQYNVNIDYQGNDSSSIIIYNFYNLGYNLEVYGVVEDTLITILLTNNFQHDFSGTGHFERDFSAIYWHFSYFGQTVTDPQIEAVFRRP